MSEREFDKFLDILQRWHKDDYYTTADALGDARALFEAEHAKVSEPKLDTRAERAELQVSLLNEIGLTLTAVAKAQVAQGVSMVTAFASHTQRLQNIADDRDRDHQLYRQMDERIQGLGLSMVGDYTSLAQKIFDLAETQAAQRKSLEGMQGLLVELEHSFDVIAEVQANSYDAVVTKFMHIEKCLAQIEERLPAKSHTGRCVSDGYMIDGRPHCSTCGKLIDNSPRKAGKRKRVKR